MGGFLSKKQEAILKAYAVQMAGEYSPNYNLGPTQEGWVITADEPGIAQPMHFGLIPHWAADNKTKYEHTECPYRGSAHQNNVFTVD
jgi:putative SOS response-associated peptidase YedK